VVAAAPAVTVPAVTPPAAAPAPKAAGFNGATVVIKAPTDVRILVDGQLTPRSAAEETFTTPALDPGRTYQYVFKAEAVRDGKTVALTKRVEVQAGRQSEVDFRDQIPAGTADVARVTVQLPDDGKLYVDGVLCPLDSASRTFNTPRLEPGRQYYYTLKAEVVREGQTQSESRRVFIEAGRQTTVDFRSLGGVQAALR
jgi:uncharacterized protein (TIGR03000 family)